LLGSNGESDEISSWDLMDDRRSLQPERKLNARVPCHYNCPAFFSKKYSPADENMFKNEVNKLGIECKLLYSGDSIEI